MNAEGYRTIKMRTTYGIDMSWEIPENAPMECVRRYRADVELSDGEYQVVLTVNSNHDLI